MMQNVNSPDNTAVLMEEGLSEVNGQPSIGQKRNRQLSKMENFNRQPSIKPGIISRKNS